METAIVQPGELLTVAQFIGLIAAPLMSLLVGLVTKVTGPSWVKSVLLLGLAVVNGLLVEITSGGPFDLRVMLMRAGAAWITAIAIHFGFWKPTGVADKALASGVK